MKHLVLRYSLAAVMTAAPAIGSLKSKNDEVENETISITRTNQVFPKGGAAGSTFEVRIVNSIDVLVAATGI